jgi:flagellar basal-body rod protein FlgB
MRSAETAYRRSGEGIRPMQLQLLTALAEKMKWHQARQGLLAENVANAETPGFRGRDLAAFSFSERMAMAGVETAATHPAHLVAGPSPAGGFGVESSRSFEVTPEGNNVSLEDEMMKVTANQMDYQAVTTLYARSVKLIRTALGRQA